MVSLSPTEVELACRRFDLQLDRSREVVHGRLVVRGRHEGMVFYPLAEVDEIDGAVEDDYLIEISLQEEDTFGTPLVREVGGKIAEHALHLGRPLRDFHVKQSDSSCCLGIYPQGLKCDLSVFIAEHVVPFFYWQSYLYLFSEEPWPGYSHERTGIDEYAKERGWLTYLHAAKMKPCPCRSGKLFKQCHYKTHPEIAALWDYLHQRRLARAKNVSKSSRNWFRIKWRAGRR